VFVRIHLRPWEGVRYIVLNIVLYCITFTSSCIRLIIMKGHPILGVWCLPNILQHECLRRRYIDKSMNASKKFNLLNANKCLNNFSYLFFRFLTACANLNILLSLEATSVYTSNKRREFILWHKKL
jgi:hypothetical protein